MSNHNGLVITAEAGLPFVDAIREIDAPVTDVYRAYTEPNLVAQWLGPREMITEMGEYNVTIGGRWQMTHRNPEGAAFGFRGVFHDVAPEDHIVQTFEFDGAPGHASLERVSFADLGGRTRITVHAVYQSVADRDAMVASGMERGMSEGYDRLEELLAAGK